MREIKFRAWQKHHKEMFDVGAIQFHDPRFVVKSLSLSTWTFDEVEIMQFTGLIDSLGKEIYESDIVRFIGERNAGDWAIISFRRGSFCFDASFDALNDGGFRVTSSPLYNENEAEWKVIGNVYENPEMLTTTR